METLEWLQNWFSSQCDGEWEHEYSIRIQTMDNPGWWISIDLMYTPLADSRIRHERIETGSGEWLYFNLIDACFNAFCSPKNIQLAIEEFRLIAEMGEAEYIATHTYARHIYLDENYSLSKGLPAIIVSEIKEVIDKNKITSETMPYEGEHIAKQIKPHLEEITKTNNTDMKKLTEWVYKYSWDYIYSK